jgi:hypothetical protein
MVAVDLIGHKGFNGVFLIAVSLLTTRISLIDVLGLSLSR